MPAEEDIQEQTAQGRTEPTPVEREVQRLRDLLEQSPAEAEPLGACVYIAGQQTCCARMTQMQCGMIGGTWFDSQPCPPPDAEISEEGRTLSPVEAAIVASRRNLAAGKPASEAVGVCVFAAGEEVCQAPMVQLHCELIGGSWFPPHAAEPAATSGPS